MAELEIKLHALDLDSEAAAAIEDTKLSDDMDKLDQVLEAQGRQEGLIANYKLEVTPAAGTDSTILINRNVDISVAVSKAS